MPVAESNSNITHSLGKPAIVFVATTPFAVNAFLRSHLLLLAKTYDVTLCVNTAAYPLDKDIQSAVRIQHIDIARKIAPWQDLRAFVQLLESLWVLRPVVVHSMTPKAGLLAMFAGRLTRVPWCFHTFTGQIWANKTGMGRLLFKGIDRLIALAANAVFADSTSQCRFLEQQGVVGTNGVTVLGEGSVSGVDLERFHPDSNARMSLRTELDLNNEIPVFVFVGRLVRDKGVFDLVEAFANVNAAYPNWELWMVGPDEDGLEKKLSQYGQKVGANIRWFGRTFSPERYMAAADVFVLPSYREGFGSAIIEAAACAIPTIAYKIDGVIDAVVDGRTGVLIDIGDLRGFAQAMKDLGNSPDKRNRLGQSAFQRAVEYFSSTKVSGEWQAFYDKLLKPAV
jgi:glycosyltransferase involved in cell wall biosynthesis